VGESARQFVVVSGGRVLEVPSSLAAHHAYLANSVAWWESLALLGASLAILGALTGAVLGTAAAICGFTFFLITAVIAGTERYEFATALGVSGIVWTSTGISVSLGTDPSLVGSFVAFEVFGVSSLAVGVLGAVRAKHRTGRETA
jgi:hypothetical protein